MYIYACRSCVTQYDARLFSTLGINQTQTEIRQLQLAAEIMYLNNYGSSNFFVLKRKEDDSSLKVNRTTKHVGD